MKSRYYLGVLIVLLTILGGLAGQQHNRLHNQVIVFHFSENSANTIQSRSVIEAVKTQLQDEGAENILVSQSENGSFVLKYFSDKNVETVEQGLSKISGVKLDKIALNADSPPTNNPIEEKDTYDFDIYEIQNWHDFDSSMDQNSAIIVKSELLRFSVSLDPVYLFIYSLDSTSVNTEISYKHQRDVLLQINDVAQIIPEVRAGPFSS